MYKDTAIIGFAGFCKSDIMLYLSRILYVLGEKIAIIDRSHEQELMFSVPDPIGSENMVQYRGIDIYLGCQDTSLNDLPAEDYSVVFMDFGVNQKAYKDIKHLKVLFIVTDCNRHHTIPLSDWLRNLPLSSRSVRILRDIVYGKIRPRYIDSLLQAVQFTQIIAKYEFPFSETEYISRLHTQYDDIFKFTKISSDYKNMLIDCITEIFGKEKKLVVKAYKKASAGG